MIKQEQIEEMVNCNKCIHKKICKNEFKGAPIIEFQGCEYYQPELLEDSVVLSREEQEKILTATEKRIKELKKQILQARKETAEKIFTELLKEKELIDLGCGDGTYEYIAVDDLKDLAKQYNIEIKE